MKGRKFCNILMWASFLILGLSIYSIIPESWHQFALYALFITAGISCWALYTYKNAAIELCGIPALVCILSGLSAGDRILHQANVTIGEAGDAFCHFICGIWCIYLSAKLLEKEKGK